MRTQVKSLERVRNHGEVFTAEREVNAMLDLVKNCAKEIDSTFFEPACGDGNFLVSILRRKLDTAFSLCGNNHADLEYWATRAFSTIYGVDIQWDNVCEARERMYNDFFARYVNAFKRRPTDICANSIRFILDQNIQQGNTLEYKKEDDSPLYITKWFFDDANGLIISIYDYKEMVDTGCDCKPIQILPRIHYLFLPAIGNRG